MRNALLAGAVVALAALPLAAVEDKPEKKKGKEKATFEKVEKVVALIASTSPEIAERYAKAFAPAQTP